MKIFIFILLLCFFSSSAYAVEIQKMGRIQDEEGRDLCTLKIDFGSFDEKTIDLESYKKIKEFIEGYKHINAATSYPWGSQVGGTFCLTINDDSAASYVYGKIKDIIPQRSKLFWTKIRHIDGIEYRTVWDE